MLLTQRIELTGTRTPASEDVMRVHGSYEGIAKVNVNDLINNLLSENIDVKPEFSQVRLQYQLKKKEKLTETTTAWVPLDLDIPGSHQIGYVLRDGQGLELKIEPYHLKEEPGKHADHAEYKRSIGITCDVTLNAQSFKSINPDILDKIVNALKKTYSREQTFVFKFPD